MSRRDRRKRALPVGLAVEGDPAGLLQMAHRGETDDAVVRRNGPWTDRPRATTGAGLLHVCENCYNLNLASPHSSSRMKEISRSSVLTRSPGAA